MVNSEQIKKYFKICRFLFTKKKPRARIKGKIIKIGRGAARISTRRRRHPVNSGKGQAAEAVRLVKRPAGLGENIIKTPASRRGAIDDD